jgi:hypothetical protein
MSLIAVQGGATGTGTVTLLAPVTNTNQTLTLPDATDTVAGIAATQTLTNKTLTSPTLTTPNIDSAQFATVTGTAPIFPCRAWVNFNGTGTVAIRASGNVSSITDNGTGDYTVNFTTAMPDAEYGVSMTQNTSTVAQDAAVSSIGILLTAALGSAATTKSTTALRILARYIVNGGAGVFDANESNVAIFR